MIGVYVGHGDGQAPAAKRAEAVVKLGGPTTERIPLGRAGLTINLGERDFDPPRDLPYRTLASVDVAIPPA